MLCISIPLYIVTEEGSAQSQCYTDSNCTGDTFASDDVRECCVGTDDGLSFSDGSVCTICIGILY